MILSRRELRELKEREDQEITQLRNEEALANERAHHYNCFVEDLGGHELFQQLFDDCPIDNRQFVVIKEQ